MSVRIPHQFALIAACASLVATGGMVSGVHSVSSYADEGTPTLTRLTETRATQVVKPAEEEGMFVMPSEEPALTLTFALALPKGVQVMSLQQPATVTALDSAGTDLAKIKPGFSDELEYVELEHDFKDDDDVCEISLKLLPSARAASTFSAQASFNAVVFTGNKSVEVEAKADWVSLTDEALAGTAKPVRFRAKDDGLEFEPADIEDRIEEITLQVGPNEVVESNGWFSDGSTITFLFDSMPAQRPLKANITLRTGVKTIPLTIDVKNQPLP